MSALSLTLLGVIILLVIIYFDSNKQKEQKVEKIENKEVEENDKKPVYIQLLNIPLWAIYFLILSTVGLTVVILAKIWFPEFFDEEFFWRIFFSYLTLMISTVVISKMAEAIRFVKKQEE